MSQEAWDGLQAEGWHPSTSPVGSRGQHQPCSLTLSSLFCFLKLLLLALYTSDYQLTRAPTPSSTPCSPSVQPSIWPSTHSSIHSFAHLPAHPVIYGSICSFIHIHHIPIYLSIHLNLSIHLPTDTQPSSCLSSAHSCVCLPVHPSAHPSLIHLSNVPIHPPRHVSIHLYLSICSSPSVRPSIQLPASSIVPHICSSAIQLPSV